MMGVLEFGLAVWVLAKDPKSRIHHWFSLFSVGLAGWTFIGGLELLLLDKFSIDYWDRTLFFCAYAGSFFLLQFSFVYPYPKKKTLLTWISTLLFIVNSILLFFSDLIIAAPFEKTISNIQAYHPVYIIGFLFNWLGAIYFLIQSYQRSAIQFKKQVQLLIIGVFFGALLGVITSFIFPYLKPTIYISQLWPPALAFIIFIFSVKVLRIAYSNQK